MTTTAEFRTAARNAEQALNWSEAARLYAQAVAAYPRRSGRDSLAERDIELLNRRAASCAAMAQA